MSSSPRVCLAVLGAVVLGVLAGAQAEGQCTPQWLPGDGLAGVDGTVHATLVWDPDGAGPAPARLVVGGEFTIAGDAFARNIAVWDPLDGSWSALGEGTNGAVFALAAVPNGSGGSDLVAGGFFTVAGGRGAGRIASWDGSAWRPLGVGMNDSVNALVVLPGGELVAGGRFTTAGGAAAGQLARWDGRAWSGVGGGVGGGASGPQVRAFAVMDSGDLIVGGDFTSAGGISADHIARWDGGVWSGLGGGVNGVVHALTVLPNGEVVAGGEFTSAGGVSAARIAQWDGTGWRALGQGVSNHFGLASVFALTTLASGDLIAGGWFGRAGTTDASNVARWDGSRWWRLSSRDWMGPGATRVRAAAVVPGGPLVIGGEFGSIGEVGVSGVAAWDEQEWSPLGGGLNERVMAMIALPEGELVVGGVFTWATGVSLAKVARWSDGRWWPMGIELGGVYTWVSALWPLPDGEVAAGGEFIAPGGASLYGLAHWDGSRWHRWPALPDEPVTAFATLPRGDLIAGGWFHWAGSTSAKHVARWDGREWHALGSGMDRAVFSLAVLPNGHLVAGGEFSIAGGVPASRIASWDGDRWSALGAGVGGERWVRVYALAVLDNGELVAGGTFSRAGGVTVNSIARWDGEDWHPMGGGMGGGIQGPTVFALAVLPNGDVIAGGDFETAGAVPAQNIARWDGVAWNPLESGLRGQSPRTVAALAVMPDGRLAAGGSFTSAGPHVSSRLAIWGCPPCYPDCDGDGQLDFFDFLCFQNSFLAGDPYADCDGSGQLDFFDFLCFQNEFLAGCS
jgi:trimeric autotransporter adhesin